MGSSFPFIHCAQCTTSSSWPGSVGQHYRLNSSCFISRLASSPRDLLQTPGLEASSNSSKIGGCFPGDGSVAFSRQSPKLVGTFLRSQGLGFRFRKQALCGKLGKTHRTLRRSERLLTVASTTEREWQDYEDAVQQKDLAGSLEVLDVLNSFESDAAVSLPESEIASSTAAHSSLQDAYPVRSPIGRPQTHDDLRILDASQMGLDLPQVGQAYDWLASKGFLPNFGKEKDIASEGDRVVTDDILVESIGLNASKLSPKKWGWSGNSAIALPVGITLFSFIRDSGVDVRPVAALVLALGFYDAIYLGGTGLLQIFSMWLPYKRRVLVHEAGHVLVAYLLGCPIRGVILDPVQAMKVGVQGQAGTQFWDKTLEMQFLQAGQPSLSVDRYSIVIYAGIAAEALIYGEAQGGESDENLYKSAVGLLQPSWSPAKMSNQARWAVLQAFQLLKKHKKAHAAVVRALEQEAGLGSLIRAMEDAMR